MRLAIPVILLIITVWVVCRDERKHWPNFSCHPYKPSKLQKSITNLRGMAWDSCKESFDKYKGRCPKICILVKREVLIRTKKNGPFTINADTFVGLMVDELGIDTGNSSDTEKALMNKVRSEMEQCKISHPEHATLTTKGTPCEPWHNVTSCIGRASGCPDP